MTLVVFFLAISVVALWLRQLWFERGIKNELKRVEEDSGPTYYR